MTACDHKFVDSERCMKCGTSEVQLLRQERNDLLRQLAALSPPTPQPNRTRAYPDADILSECLPNYLVCTPYYGGWDGEHIGCYEALKREYRALRCYRVTGCPYIDMARAVAAARCIEGGFDGLFFVDHDIIFDPQELVGMMRAAHREQAIVYAMYCMRQSGRRTIGMLPGEGKRDFGKGGGLVPGDHGGLGFAAIPRAALETIGAELPTLETSWAKCKAMFALRAGFPDWAELYDALWSAGLLVLDSSPDEAHRPLFARVVREVSGSEYVGEDGSFFHRARRHGIPILCDTRPRIAHKGSYKYGLEDVQLVVPRARSLTIDFQAPDNGVGLQPIEAVGAAQFEGLEDMRSA
jgi:hypothetical protein